MSNFWVTISKGTTMLVHPLDKNSSEPLYSQLFDRLRNMIETGELSTGDRLPAERELAESLSVSRITARQAIDALVKSGLVYRERGRGTFVAEPHMHHVMNFTSFSQDMVSRGLHPSSQVLTQELTCVDEKLQKVLKLGPDGLAIHIVRIRLADGNPLALQSTYLPYSLCPGLETRDLNSASLYSLLRENYYINPAWTEAKMEVQCATEEEAHHLQIDISDPVLIVKGVTFTESFDIIESVRTVYRGKGLSLYIGRQRIPTFSH
jgi:GntR family transcriptional regulator